MTELSAIKIKATLFFSAVVYAVGVAIYVHGFMVAAEKDIEHIKGQIHTIGQSLADVNRTRWTSEAHDRYARDVERRLVRLESK